jgi:hypothetical protein
MKNRGLPEADWAIAQLVRLGEGKVNETAPVIDASG